MSDAQETQAAPSRARLIPAADLLAAVAPQRRPDWIKVRAPAGAEFERLRSLMRTRGLHTVCEEALCPNIGECWGSGTATFLMMGNICTRS